MTEYFITLMLFLLLFIRVTPAWHVIFHNIV